MGSPNNLTRWQSEDAERLADAHNIDFSDAIAHVVDGTTPDDLLDTTDPEATRTYYDHLDDERAEIEGDALISKKVIPLPHRPEETKPDDPAWYDIDLR